LIEACEESGSFDLPAYIEHLAPRIGTPSLVVCLDSGCGDYERLWSTTSLRGMVVGDLTVEILEEGVHSGDASGIVPSSFRIARGLIERVEEAGNGALKNDVFFAQIPEQRRAQAAAAAKVLGAGVYDRFPFAEATQPYDGTPEDLILNRTWRPTLSVVGAAGMPPLEDAGNVLRASTSLKLSFRVPPTCDAERAKDKVKSVLENDPPYGARVTFDAEASGQGWNAPQLEPWLEASINNASESFFGRGAAHMGEGGSIPFMSMLGEKFPSAQFLVTGVLGPASNAHGPNEFLHIPTGKNVTGCVAYVLADHFNKASG